METASHKMFSPSLTKLSGTKDANSPATLQVDVIADLVCPWCYLGKRRLEEALSAVHGPSLISWYPFQLNPGMPATGMALEEYLASKFGDPQKLEPAMSQIAAAGAEVGIRFHFDKVDRVPNTLNAHRVMRLAEASGADASALAEEIMSAFFEQGLDIADRDVLSGLAETQGLSTRETHQTLDEERSMQVVLAQEAQVRQSGVTGVPDFLINKRLLVIGAQSTESLVNVFDRVMFGAESDLPVSPVIH